MARRKRMSEGKKNIIAALVQEYDIQSAEDIQDALKDLLGDIIKEMCMVAFGDCYSALRYTGS